MEVVTKARMEMAPAMGEYVQILYDLVTLGPGESLSHS